METIFYFGRLNLIAAYDDYSVKRGILIDALTNHKSLTARGFKYAFTKVLEMKLEDEQYITGFLIKYAMSDERSVFDESKWEPSETAYGNSVLARSSFILEVNSGYIAYNAVRDHISENSFRGIYSKLFVRNSNSLFVNIEIDPVGARYEILKEAETYTRITKIRVQLKPSNPSSSEIWKKIDDKMKANGIDKLTEEIEAKKEGKSINLDSFDIKPMIIMAEDGYGSASIEGEIEGEKARVTTGQNQITKPVTNPTILEEVLGTIKEVFDRLNKRIRGED